MDMPVYIAVAGQDWTLGWEGVDFVNGGGGREKH